MFSAALHSHSNSTNNSNSSPNNNNSNNNNSSPFSALSLFGAVVDQTFGHPQHQHFQLHQGPFADFEHNTTSFPPIHDLSFPSNKTASSLSPSQSLTLPSISSSHFFIDPQQQQQQQQQWQWQRQQSFHHPLQRQHHFQPLLDAASRDEDDSNNRAEGSQTKSGTGHSNEKTNGNDNRIVLPPLESVLSSARDSFPLPAFYTHPKRPHRIPNKTPGQPSPPSQQSSSSPSVNLPLPPTLSKKKEGEKSSMNCGLDALILCLAPYTEA